MKKFNIAVSALAILVTAGCATNKISEEKYSGFLDNYPQLEQSETYPETRLYITPNVNFSTYQSVIIDKVKIIFPDGLERPDNTLVSSIANAYEEELKTSFRNKGYEVTQEAKPGVARIQAAITSTYTSFDDLKAYQLIPVSAVITGVMRASGVSQKSARVMTEAKVTDAQTGNVLVTVIDLQEGKELESSDSKVTLNDVNPVLKQWAERFADGLARLQKK